MQSTLTQLLVDCVNEGQGEGGGGIIDPRRYPQQILCLAEQVLFTERCEAAIAEGRLAELLIELETQLDSYTNADISVSLLGELSELENKDKHIDTYMIQRCFVCAPIGVWNSYYVQGLLATE